MEQSRSNWSDVLNGPFWDVSNWDQLRAAISFLTLMNKRGVLYFRGQGTHYEKCLPVLLRNSWSLNGQPFALNPSKRGQYYASVRKLQDDVFRVVKKVGSPRTYILEYFPAATAVLQHYELWLTHFIDITRSIPTAIAFAQGTGNRRSGFLYVFSMPDLRGSVTSDIDQHITLARLEAVCPPDARRPHHQDAYLVARFPEPQSNFAPKEKSWDDWQRKTDLMRRLVAKFRLILTNGQLSRASPVAHDFLIPPLAEDHFGQALLEEMLPITGRLASTLKT